MFSCENAYEDEDWEDSFPKMRDFWQRKMLFFLDKHECVSQGIEFPEHFELDEEEKMDLLREAKENFRSTDRCSEFGEYYEIMHELGFHLDPLDEFLLNPDYNNMCNAIVPANISDSEVYELQRQAARGHNIVIMFARLNSWASKVSQQIDGMPTWSNFEKGPFEKQSYEKVPLCVSLVNPEATHRHMCSKEKNIGNNIQNASKELTEMCIEEKLEILGIFMNLFKTQDGPGLCTLFNYSRNDGELHLITFGNIEKYLVAMEIMFRNACNGKKPIPKGGNFTKPINVLLENAVTTFLSKVATGMKKKQGRWHRIFHYFLQKALSMLSIAALVDSCIARAISATSVADIVNALLDEIQNSQNTVNAEETQFTAHEAELSFFQAFNLIKNVSNVLIESKSFDKFKAADEQTESDENNQRCCSFLLPLAPTLLRAVSDVNNPTLCFFALEIFELFTSFSVPEELALFLLKKTSWAVLSSRLNATSCLTETSDETMYAGHCLRLEHDRINNTETLIDSIEKVRKLERLGLLRLIRNMCLYSQRLHGQGHEASLSTGKAGLKLIKRGVVLILLQIVSNKEEDDEVMRYVAEILQCLTRTRDCRVLMLRSQSAGEEDPKVLYGLPLITKLLNHRDALVVSHSILSVVHLLWDTEWQPIIASMRELYTIEIIVAAMAISAVRELERIAVNYREASQNKMFRIFGQEESLTQRELEYEKYLSTLEEYQKEMRGGKFYPFFDRTKFDLFTSLSRCVILLAHLNPTIFGCHLEGDVYRNRLNAIHAVEFLAACISFHAYEIDFHSCIALHNLTDQEVLSPALLPDPQSFVNNVLQQCTFLVDMDFNDPNGGRTNEASASKQQQLKLGLLMYMKADSRWEKFIKKGRKHLENIAPDYLSKDFLDNLFNPPTNTESHFATFVHKRPSFHTDFLQIKVCANTECGVVEKKKGQLKQCSRCREALYCSRKCQVAHWKKHKKDCK